MITSDARKKPSLTQESTLRFLVEADSVRLLPAAGDVRRLKGRLAKPAHAVSVAAMNTAIAQRRARAGR